MAKTIYLFILLGIIYSCKSQQATISKTPASDTTITNLQVAEIIDTLSNDYYEGRGFDTQGIEMAAQYIENYLKNIQVPPYFYSYRDTFKIYDRTGYNIVGFIEGKDPELKKETIILSAHYDHVGILKRAKPDSIRNGANDNASGVSAVLNIAKQIKKSNKNKRSIIIALFSGEELGLRGSDHFAQKIQDSTKNLYCGINIDMIGSVLTDKPGRLYLSGENRSNIRDIFNKYIGENEIVQANIKGGYYDIFMLSDNYPLYKHLKIPAHTFCTFDFNNYPHYHKVSDEIKHVDIENTAIIIRKIAIGIKGILNSDNKEIKLTQTKKD